MSTKSVPWPVVLGAVAGVSIYAAYPFLVKKPPFDNRDALDRAAALCADHSTYGGFYYNKPDSDQLIVEKGWEACLKVVPLANDREQKRQDAVNAKAHAEYLQRARKDQAFIESVANGKNGSQP